MVTIGFLHTSPVHVPVFDALVAELGGGHVVAISEVDEGLLTTARTVGATDPAVTTATQRHLRALAGRGAEVIVCTCSTVGGVAEELGEQYEMDVVRVDRPMAERAVDIGGRIIVLAALESTLGPSGVLLDSVVEQRHRSPAAIEFRVVEGAWERFELDDVEGYHALVADAIVRAGDEADVIVLAQASMAPAADVVRVDVPVLSSPRSAVSAVLG